jgi:hypothetical protein
VKRFTFATFFEIGRTVAHPLAEREQLQQIPASEVALRASFAAVQHRVSPSSASSPTAGASAGVLVIEAAQVRRLKAQGIGASEIAKRLKIGRASVYRILGA